MSGDRIERAVGAGMTATQSAGGMSIAKSGETSAMVLAESAKAGVIARFQMARLQPRDTDTARTRILKDCDRPRFAELAEYALPRWDAKEGRNKMITGPTIRLAEVAARAWGNIEIAAVITFEDEERRHVRVTATDFETNSTYAVDVTVAKVVERRTVKDPTQIVGQRINAQGTPVYIVRASESDLLAKHNALVSKARRNVIFALVPGDIIDEALERAKATVARADAQDPDAERRRIFDGFAKLSIEPAQLAEVLGVPTQNIGPAQLTTLRGMFAAIRDGETTIADLLATRKASAEGATTEPAPSTAASKVSKAAKAVAAAKPAEAPQPTLADVVRDTKPAPLTPEEHAAMRERGEDPDAP